MLQGPPQAPRGAARSCSSERVQQQYPALVCDVVERMFRVDNPDAQARLLRIAAPRRRGGPACACATCAKDAWTADGAFG